MQSRNPILDNVGKAMTEAVGAADGVRREAETVFRSQMQRFISEQDMVPREEFEAVKEMAARARDEVEALKARVEILEKQGSKSTKK